MTGTISDLAARLSTYRAYNDWGDPVHHTICDEAAAALTALEARADEMTRSCLAERQGRIDAEARAEAAEKERGDLKASFDAHVQEMSEQFRAVNVGRAVQMMDADLKARAEAAEKERDEAREALTEAKSALEGCYQVCDWPANGQSTQDDAIRTIDRTLAFLSTTPDSEAK